MFPKINLAPKVYKKVFPEFVYKMKFNNLKSGRLIPLLAMALILSVLIERIQNKSVTPARLKLI